MTTISLTDAQSQLPILVGQLGPQDEIVIIDGERAVARLLPADDESAKPRRRRGTAKGVLKIVAEDDEHLQDFAEYV